MNGEVDEGMCRLCKGKQTGFGSAGSKERSHRPDKSVLFGWKFSLETLVTVRKESKEQERMERRVSKRDESKCTVGTKEPTRFVCHVH